ncbi:Retrovirus-related Pol polyprotein from transposon RE1 [Vitis vinifera]|uniref:Retrovirus-related Pol polyprotein from transposon RE1 n=1 Tax=Vitis vinifera TaxID=29760 RepID=A0A438GQL9_VITVI|nr:Retrovirus-related Pol polyprotein from transposon RE1 [Vitis vinifera]
MVDWFDGSIPYWQLHSVSNGKASLGCNCNHLLDGSDATQVYELRRRVTRLRQGSGSLEKYYNDLQGLWREIDFRRPNPMQCPADIQHFNNMLSDVLQLKPFPTVEQAYAHVRREVVRQAVMIASNGEESAGAVMASRSLKQGPSTAATLYWWHELQAKRRRDGNGKDGGASKNATNGTGKAAIASAESQLSLIPTTTVDLDTGMSFLGTNTTESYDGWILDSGATDHMTGWYSDDITSSLLNQYPFDILTKEIIGCGTKKGGLYYMEDFSISQANHTRSSSDRNKANILLWHRRLGHPSFGYLKLVFPALFSAVHLINRMPSRVLKFKTPLQALSTIISLPTALMLPPRGAPQNKELNWLRFDWEPVVSESNTELDVEPVVYVSNTEPDVDTEPGVLTISKPPDRYSPNIEDRRLKYPIANYVSTKTLPGPLKTFADALSSCQVPTSFEEAMKDPRWVQAMKEEMEALLKNKTWILVNLPKGQKTVGCKWVFSIKYKETFSPVAKLNTVRVLLSLAANLDWPLHQFDVKNAFLHGDLEEDIYMDIPSGYVANTEGNIVCKLQRTLYRLKQSPRAWFGRFSTAMKKYGFQQSNSDHTLFLKHRQGKLTALIVYVDDMIITGDDSEEITRLQEQLASEFEMKNLGGLKYFLGIEVARSSEPTETPIIPNHKLGEYPNQVPTDKGRYQRLVGKLIYLSHTRPDIAYAVSVVGQFMHCPSEDHMSAIMQILRYLKSSPGNGLMFSKNDHLRVEGYTDADWAGNIMDRKSTSGYFTFVGGNLVTWRSKKQKVVALSSAEAEFRGMAKGLCELLWLRRLLTEIGFAPDSEMKLFCDNKAAIDISHNPIQHDRTKHIEVDRHFIKQNLDAKIIQFPFVKSEDQLADILTKAVSSKIFHHSLDKLGLIDIYVPT